MEVKEDIIVLLDIFLNYENSYAHNQGKDMSLCGFQRLEVTNNGSINSKNYYLDEVK